MTTNTCITNECLDSGDKDVDETMSLWSTLLHEVANKTSMKLPSTRILLVFGDENSGKSTLISRLQGDQDDDLKKGYGLEYTLIDIKDEERDDQTKLNVWIMDGDVAHSHLLKFPLTSTTFGECAVLITVSIAEPWDMLVSLEKWIAVLKEHIHRLPIETETLRKYKEGLLRQFHEYAEPVEPLSSENDEKNVESSSEPNSQSKLLAFRRPTLVSNCSTALPLLSLKSELQRPSIGSISEASEEEENEDGDIIRSDKNQSSSQTSTEPAVLPDSPSLSDCLGLPLVVVITKSDVMKQLENDNDFNEETFDFLQMHIREFCLKYGAALFYVSLKEDKNIGLLKRYLMSRMYGFTFLHPANVIERDSILVPTGWDSRTKIDILTENFVKIKKTTPFEQVVIRPNPNAKTIGREPELVLPDDQTFLVRLAAMEQREANTPGSTSSISALTDRLSDRLNDSKQIKDIPRIPSKPKPSYLKTGTQSSPPTGHNKGDNILKGILMGLVQKHAKPKSDDLAKEGSKSTEDVTRTGGKEEKTQEKDTCMDSVNPVTKHPSITIQSKMELKRKLMERQGKPPKDFIAGEKLENQENAELSIESVHSEMKGDAIKSKTTDSSGATPSVGHTDHPKPNSTESTSGATHRPGEVAAGEPSTEVHGDGTKISGTTLKDADAADLRLTNAVDALKSTNDGVEDSRITTAATEPNKQAANVVEPEATNVEQSAIPSDSEKSCELINSIESNDEQRHTPQPAVQQVVPSTNVKPSQKKEKPELSAKSGRSEMKGDDVKSKTTDSSGATPSVGHTDHPKPNSTESTSGATHRPGEVAAGEPSTEVHGDGTKISGTTLKDADSADLRLTKKNEQHEALQPAVQQVVPNAKVKPVQRKEKHKPALPLTDKSTVIADEKINKEASDGNLKETATSKRDPEISLPLSVKQNSPPNVNSQPEGQKEGEGHSAARAGTSSLKQNRAQNRSPVAGKSKSEGGEKVKPSTPLGKPITVASDESLLDKPIECSATSLLPDSNKETTVQSTPIKASADDLLANTSKSVLEKQPGAEK